MGVYRMSGVIVESDFALPGGVVPASHADGPPTVRIFSAPVSRQLDTNVESGPNWMLNASDFLLHVPAVGRLLAREGELLTVETEAGVEPAELLPFVLSTGWAAILAQRRLTVLHAAVIADGRTAIALCGCSGTGKSVLAAALCRAGGRLICDDMAVLGVDASGRAVVWPDGRCFQLFNDAIRSQELEQSRLAEVREGVGKYYVKPSRQWVVGPMPLGAVFLMEPPRPHKGFGVEKLTPLEAAQQLLTNSYRQRLTLAFGGAAQHVRMSAAVLRGTSVFRLNSPLGLDRVTETADRLWKHWRETS